MTAACSFLLALAVAAVAPAGTSKPAAPENLARKAKASATSEYSPAYAAAKAVDGRIPEPLGTSENEGAWAVQGDTHRGGAELVLRWKKPITAAELVYYGRCAGQWNENWKDWAIHADAGEKPVATGRLKPGRGPQRMKLPRPIEARELRIRFLSSYGGLNPGASEVQVYAVSPPDEALGEFHAKMPRNFAGFDKRRSGRRPKPAPKIVESPELLAEALDGPMEGVEEIVFATRSSGRDGHWYANFAYYAESVDRKAYGAPGGRLAALNVRTGEVRTILEDPDGAIRDPQVHYDGERIVFAWRREGAEHYRLYEVRADGSGLRQITPDAPYDDIEPTYLPDGGIMFCSARCKRWVNCWLTQVAVLYRCEADGSGLRAVSSNNEHDNTPWPLPDGRILYQRWEYVDRSQVHYHHLWTTNPDGTGQMVYFGNMQPGVVMIDAKPVPGTDKTVVLFSPGHGRREHAGPICVLDPRWGPDDPRAVRRITKASDYRDPWAFDEHTFLAARGRRILLLDDTGRRKVLYTDPHFDAHEPRPLVPRPREEVIAPRSDPSRETGRLVLADVHVGRNMAGVERGEIRKLLILETLPKPINYTGGMDPLSYGGTFTLERVVGTVPVEPDGSAYFELPAMRSFFFVALDANDLSVKRMQSFLTVQPGETTGCVGCHEQRTQTIPPIDLLATRRPPSRIEPVASVPDVLDFPRDVQPVLDRHCTGCHDYRPHENADYGPRAGGVILTGDRGPMFSHSYATLTIRKQFVDGRNNARSNLPPRSIGTSASPIMKKVAAPGAAGPRHHDVRLSDAELDVLRYWIESGAAYPGTYAALGTGMIGGYHQNRPVRTGGNWPETKAASAAIAKRCGRCHKNKSSLPRTLADENGLSFWRPNWNDPRLRFSRHLLFNLSRPELSLILLTPLAERAGGYAAAEPDAPKAGAKGEPEAHPAVFASTDDPDYLAILSMIRRGRAELEQIKRFDMPGFRPRPEYLREMKRYGVLPDTFDPATDSIDPYALDQRYWRSLWHTPPRR